MRKIIFHAHGYLPQKPWACLFIKIIVFCEDSRGRLSLQVCVAFVAWGVGDDILGVPFVRHNATISLLQWEKVPRNEADEVSLT